MQAKDYEINLELRVCRRQLVALSSEKAFSPHPVQGRVGRPANNVKACPGGDRLDGWSAMIIDEAWRPGRVSAHCNLRHLQAPLAARHFRLLIGHLPPISPGSPLEHPLEPLQARANQRPLSGPGPHFPPTPAPVVR
ncbi:hypothetical protein LIA77_04864 [Sarocladium implicatum]|nr:hypothetical protein LIA77_04864 [Sarocladium implicatum]